jgi:hypothetical protein
MPCCLRSCWPGAWMWPRWSARCSGRWPAARAGVPYTTARGWAQRFQARAGELGVAFAALAVELGGEAIRPAAKAGRSRWRRSMRRARCRDGWQWAPWRFACAVSGGRLIAANTISPCSPRSQPDQVSPRGKEVNVPPVRAKRPQMAAHASETHPDLRHPSRHDLGIDPGTNGGNHRPDVRKPLDAVRSRAAIGSPKGRLTNLTRLPPPPACSAS